MFNLILRKWSKESDLCERKVTTWLKTYIQETGSLKSHNKLTLWEEQVRVRGKERGGGGGTKNEYHCNKWFREGEEGDLVGRVLVANRCETGREIQ